ncbi:MAG: sigma-70 family RNA polymerase sigma factor [Planctomycetaceae bacterium]
MFEHSSDESEIPDLIERARAGDQPAINSLLRWSREYLRKEARQTLAPAIRARVDESDVVQTACMDVFQQLVRFHGTSVAEFKAWLKKILERDIQDAVDRHRRAGKRTVDRETPGSEPIRQAVGNESSPSRKAIRNEESRIMQSVLEQLPEDVREAMQLRITKQLTIVQVAERLGITVSETGRRFRKGTQELMRIMKLMGFSGND